MSLFGLAFFKLNMMPQNWLQQKTNILWRVKLSESTGKPKELWKSLKSLVMPNKTVISNFNAIEESNTLTFDTRSFSKIFKNFFSNLVKSLLINLPKPPDAYNLKSIIQYYSSFSTTTDFCLIGTTRK